MASKTVLVFCATNRTKPETRRVIKNLYGNSPVNVIYTGDPICAANTQCGRTSKNINRTITLPINLPPHGTDPNRNGFNRQLREFLGNRKIDLFIFEYCPLNFLFYYREPKAFNRNILNVISKYGKNNFKIITPTNQILSNRLVVNKIHNFNPMWKTFKFIQNGNWVMV